jgi:hypothetical protein
MIFFSFCSFFVSHGTKNSKKKCPIPLYGMMFHIVFQVRGNFYGHFTSFHCTKDRPIEEANKLRIPIRIGIRDTKKNLNFLYLCTWQPHLTFSPVVNTPPPPPAPSPLIGGRINLGFTFPSWDSLAVGTREKG